MNCPKCGRDVDAQWKFCNYCGESIAITCPSCAAINPADALFCHDCGAKFTADAAPMSPWRALNAERQAPARQPITPPSPTFPPPNPPPPVRPSPSLTCPRCRTVNEPGSAYCYSCGLPLDEEPTTTHVPASHTRPVGGPPYQSLRTRANWTVGLLVAICVTYALHIMVTFGVLDMVWQLEAVAVVSSAELEEALLGLDFMAFLLFLVYLPTVVLFLMWMHRAATNLPALGSDGQRFSPGWAVGWWFIPIMWFFRPYQVVAEIWRGSNPELTLGREWKRGPVSPLLGWWWALWLVSNVVGLGGGYSFGLAAAFDSDAIPSSGDLQFDMLVGALTIAAGVLATLLVLRTTRRQEARRGARRGRTHVRLAGCPS